MLLWLGQIPFCRLCGLARACRILDPFSQPCRYCSNRGIDCGTWLSYRPRHVSMEPHANDFALHAITKKALYCIILLPLCNRGINTPEANLLWKPRKLDWINWMAEMGVASITRQYKKPYQTITGRRAPETSHLLPNLQNLPLKRHKGRASEKALSVKDSRPKTIGRYLLFLPALLGINFCQMCQRSS